MLEATVMTSRTRIDGEVAYLTLTKGYVAVIDVADVLVVGEYPWFAIACGNTAYACRSGCRDRNGKRAARWPSPVLPGMLLAVWGLYQAVLLIRLPLRLLHDEPTPLPLHQG